MTQTSPRRIAVVLCIVAAVWDAFWIAKVLIMTFQRPLSDLEVLLEASIIAIHLVSLGVWFIPLQSLPGAVLLSCAAALIYLGSYYFYVVWPAAGLLLAAAPFALLIFK